MNSTILDYIIVGSGIAGTCMALRCIQQKKSFLMITNRLPAASYVAAGMYNPVVLKRFVPIHQASLQMQEMNNLFEFATELLGDVYQQSLPLYRIFVDEKESQVWKNKSETYPELAPYLNPIIHQEKYDEIIANHGIGEVWKCGWVDMPKFLNDFYNHYSAQFLVEDFDFSQLDPDQNLYKNYTYQNLIFAEGIKTLENPYFNWIPLIPNKGEYLHIETENPLLPIIWKAKGFMLPKDEHQAYVGATYDRDFEDLGITDAAKETLLADLKQFYEGEFSINEQKVGIRPTTQDRRAIIGPHTNWENLYILNGMGTRGTLIAPLISQYLINFIEEKTPFPEEYHVKRYYALKKVNL